MVKKCAARFEHGRTYILDDDRSGRQESSKTEKKVIYKGRHLKVRVVAEIAKISVNQKSIRAIATAF